MARAYNDSTTHRWLYQDQLEPVAELDSAGIVASRYVYGTRGHVPDYVVKGDSTYRIVADHLGSVRLVVNVASGWVAQRIDYDGYGRVTLDTNPGFQNLGYAGGLWDGATGLVRFGARDYDPAIGRWLSRDPIGFSGGCANLFAYASNDPIRIIDPTGLAEESAEGEGKKLLDCIQSILDALGYVDPTGSADAINAALYLVQGQTGYAAISLAAMVPFGDAAKLGKLGARAASHVDDVPRGLLDQLVMEAAKRGEGIRIIEKLKDVRFKGMEKWSYGTTSGAGLRSEVHYVRNPLTGELMDFKFKMHAKTYR